jgi:galactose-1-phosphate uridylyltransferase
MVLIFKKVLKALEKIYKKYEFSTLPFAYNFYIYPKENWYLRLIPRFVNRAGFELGTGLSVNIVDPKDAAEEIKNILSFNN